MSCTAYHFQNGRLPPIASCGKTAAVKAPHSLCRNTISPCIACCAGFGILIPAFFVLCEWEGFLGTYSTSFSSNAIPVQYQKHRQSPATYCRDGLGLRASSPPERALTDSCPLGGGLKCLSGLAPRSPFRPSQTTIPYVGVLREIVTP